MIKPEVFVVLFLFVSMAGARFNYWMVMSSTAFIGGVIVATELSKHWGWL